MSRSTWFIGDILDSGIAADNVNSREYHVIDGTIGLLPFSSKSLTTYLPQRLSMLAATSDSPRTSRSKSHSRVNLWDCSVCCVISCDSFWVLGNYYNVAQVDTLMLYSYRIFPGIDIMVWTCVKRQLQCMYVLRFCLLCILTLIRDLGCIHLHTVTKRCKSLPSIV